MKKLLVHAKNSFAFAIAGGLATMVLTLSLYSKDDAILWTTSITLVFISYFLWREIVIKQKLSPRLFFISLCILVILGALLLPTPLKYLYTSELLWGSIAALLFNVINGQSQLNTNSGKWTLAMLIPWGISWLIGEVFTQIYYGKFIEFPNGVYLGYNFYFLATSFSIFTIYLLYRIRPTLKQGLKFLFRIILGTFLGYILSIPLVYLLLQFPGLDEYQYFIVAMAGRTICENIGGGIFASSGLAAINMRLVVEESDLY